MKFFVFDFVSTKVAFGEAAGNGGGYEVKKERDELMRTAVNNLAALNVKLFLAV